MAYHSSPGEDFMEWYKGLFSGSGGGSSNQPSGRMEFGHSDYGFSPAYGYTPAAPTALGSGPGPGSGSDWFGRNEAGLKMGLGALRSIGNLYTGIQAGNLANKQFEFNKNYANQNLAAQIQSYNQRTENRANSHAAYLGSTAPENYARDYIDKHKLSRSYT